MELTDDMDDNLSSSWSKRAPPSERGGTGLSWGDGASHGALVHHDLLTGGSRKRIRNLEK